MARYALRNPWWSLAHFDATRSVSELQGDAKQVHWQLSAEATEASTSQVTGFQYKEPRTEQEVGLNSCKLYVYTCVFSVHMCVWRQRVVRRRKLLVMLQMDVYRGIGRARKSNTKSRAKGRRCAVRPVLRGFLIVSHCTACFLEQSPRWVATAASRVCAWCQRAVWRRGCLSCQTLKCIQG
jgi:hypothetical protein